MAKKVEKFEKPESCSHENCNCGGCCCGGKVLLIVLALLGVIAAIMACFYACKAAKVAQQSYDLNILSAGGIDNFKKMNELYASDSYIQYATQQTDIYVSNFSDSESDYNEDNTANATDPEEVKTIVEEMLASTPIRGDKNARFTIVEYTELLCPYCQRHSQEGTINSVLEQFPGEVNSISRHFIIHGDTALQLAAAMECIAELKPEVYHETFDQAFAAYPVDLATLTSIATDLGVNEGSLQTCIDEGRYVQSVNDMMDQANRLFGVNGTPGNVIIDRETGNYELVSGAYPVETFVEAINSMK